MLVLDIHGNHQNRPSDVDFGTRPGDSLLGREWLVANLAAQLRAEGLLNLSESRFAESGKEAVTTFTSRSGLPAIQREISATRLQTGHGCAAGDPTTCGRLEGYRFAQVLHGFVRYLDAMGQCELECPSSTVMR